MKIKIGTFINMLTPYTVEKIEKGETEFKIHPNTNANTLVQKGK